MKTSKKLILYLLINIFNFSYLSSNEKIKMYIFYTPSHKIFYDNWFKPSLKDDYEIISEVYNQECSSGNFMENGWMQAMLHKVDLIIRAIKENWNEVFIHADVDIQWFSPTKKIILDLMKDKDMMIQQDTPASYQGGKWGCAGFFACRGNEKTLTLWQKVRENMVKNPQSNDQWELNYLLKGANPFNIRWDFLPAEFFSAGTLTGKHWNPGDSLPIPQNIKIHHANWTAGNVNKIKQLEYVKKEVLKRSQTTQN